MSIYTITVKAIIVAIICLNSLTASAESSDQIEYVGRSEKIGISITLSYGNDGGNEFYYGDVIHFSRTAAIIVNSVKYGSFVFKNIISTTDGSGNDLFKAFEYSESESGIEEVASLSYEHEGGWIVGYISFPTFGKNGDTDFPQHWNNSVTLNEGDIKVSDK